MDNRTRFGVFLPTFIRSDDDPRRAQNLLDFARHAEDLGFDSLFVTDHLLTARRFYSVSWLESITTLSFVAGVTRQVRLGTSVLVLPVREPVLLAKQLATLQFLSNNRLILGAGVGWYEPEFQAVGAQRSQRGRRTDEILDIALRLLNGETVSYDGRFYSPQDVFIEPRSTRSPELWIGGGSQLASDRSPDLPRLVPAVRRRILRADGWIPRPTCPPDDIARDWAEIRDGLRLEDRDTERFTVAHENFMHLVMTDDPAKAREEQHRAFLSVMSAERGPQYLESVYLFGTPEELIAKLQARVDAGARYFMLHTLTPNLDQLDRWVEEIIPHLQFPEP